MHPRISLITLGVHDLPRAIRFYQHGLGLPRCQEAAEGVAFFNLQGSWLALYPWQSLAGDAGLPAEGSGFRGVTLAHNLADREQVVAVYDEAIAAGATPLQPPHDVFWGGYVAYFADPDGHVWELAWNPAFWPGPADHPA